MRRASDWARARRRGRGGGACRWRSLPPALCPERRGLAGASRLGPLAGVRGNSPAFRKKGERKAGAAERGELRRSGPFPARCRGRERRCCRRGAPLAAWYGTASGGCPARRAGARLWSDRPAAAFFAAPALSGAAGPARRFRRRRVRRTGAGKAALPVRARPGAPQKAGAVARGRSGATGRKRHLRPVRRRGAYRPKRSVTRKSRPASGA